jgi:site-specific recombinase XerD
MNTLAAAELFLNNRRALGRTEKARKWYNSNLKRFATACPELPTEPEPIEAFIATFPDKMDETRHGYFRTIRALYRFLYRRRHISSNPMDFVDPPKRTKKVQPTLEPSEMLLLSIQPKNPRDKTILYLLADNGVRASELVTLVKQQIFSDFIVVKGKEGQRLVPISEDTRRMLLALVIPESDYIFRGQRGALTPSGLYQLIRKCMDKTSISGPKRGPHRLRHAFGKNFLENGGEIRTLQKILGHADVKTTQIYANLANSSIIEKHHQFTPLRSMYAAAQGSFFQNQAVQEAEAILSSK